MLCPGLCKHLRLLHKPLQHALSCSQLGSRANSSSRVLGHTTLLLQDGLEIHELPLVIRRMSAAEFPFGSAIYGGEGHIQTTAQEEQFKQELQDCVNVRQVFSLLEVPGDHVTAYSASFALQRLHQLRQGSSTAPDSFIRQAIFHELCDTATRDIHKLTTDVLCQLVNCYLNSKTFNAAHKQLINEEIEKRVGDGHLSITQICMLIRLLSEHPEGSSELVRNLWTHIAVRYQDLDHNNLSEVFGILRYIIPSHRYVLKMLDKPVAQCWWKLQVDDVVAVTKALSLLRHESIPILRDIGKWLFINIHDVKDAHLPDILGLFIVFEINDSNVIKALERYVPAKKDKLDKNVSAVVMEYLRTCRYLSPKICDIVAQDFTKTHEKYDIDEIFYALRPFGQLNYLPPNSSQFFLAIEDSLLSRFKDFPAHKMLELLASFVYIRRIPANFISQVFNPHFLSKIKGLPEHSLRVPAGLFLYQLYTAACLELPSQSVPYLDTSILGGVSTFMSGRWFRFHNELGLSLAGLFSPKFTQEAEIVKSTPYFIDFVVHVDTEPSSSSDHLKKKKVPTAILTVMPEHTCVNTKHLLGPYALRQRHLKALGYTVVEVHYQDFMWDRGDREEKQEYLRKILGETTGKT